MMESSQESRDPTAPAGQGASPAGQQVAPQGVESQEAVHEDQPAPAATGHAVPPGQERPGQDADREPAADQAPVATEAQKTITGDPGLRGEQVPQQVEGSPSAVDRPVGTSMPPPEAQ